MEDHRAATQAGSTRRSIATRRVNRMKTLLVVLFALITPQIAVAEDIPPTESSVRELIEITHSRRQIEVAIEQAEVLMRRALEQSLGRRTISEEQQAIIDEMRGKIMAVYRAEFSWERLAPLFVEIYRRSFTQEEVYSMLAFYRSQSGQAVVAKMPIVMENTVRLMQAHMAAMSPKVQKLQRETIAQLWASEHRHP